MPLAKNSLSHNPAALSALPNDTSHDWTEAELSAAAEWDAKHRSAGTYAVIPAPGYWRDYTRPTSVHANLRVAIWAAQHDGTRSNVVRNRGVIRMDDKIYSNGPEWAITGGVDTYAQWASGAR